MRNLIFILLACALPCAAAPSARQEKPAAPAAAEQAAAQPAPDPYEEALGRLKSDKPDLRRQAVVYLGRLRDEKAVPHLTAALEDAAAPVRRAAVDALGLLAWRPAAPRLAGLVQDDPDAAVRQQAAISLAYLMDQQSGPALVKALGDAALPVRFAAIHTLGAIRYKPAEGPIAALLEKADANLLRSAISALGMLQSTAAAAAIAPALGHASLPVRVEAARALGEIGSGTVTRALADRLAPAEAPAVRVECALALAKLGSAEGLPVAREYLSSADPALKGQALTAVLTALDLESLPLVEKLAAAETDPALVQQVEAVRQRLLEAQAERKAAEAKP